MTTRNDVSKDFADACAELRERSRTAPSPTPSTSDYPPLTPDLLEGVGEALFGRNWKTELAEEMGWKDASRIRAMMRGERSVPAIATPRAIALMQGRIATLQAMLVEIEDTVSRENVAAE